MKILVILILVLSGACATPTSPRKPLLILPLNPNEEAQNSASLVTSQKFDRLSQSVRFNENSVLLNTSSKKALAEIAKEIINSEYEFDVIKLRGLQDVSENNPDLSQKRADTVRDYLIQKGVLAEKLEAIGQGKAALDADLTPVERARDRRVDFEIVENTETQAL